nr:MAG TPA: hypothetical protein [Caudoviricetes sp.]
MLAGSFAQLYRRLTAGGLKNVYQLCKYIIYNINNINIYKYNHSPYYKTQNVCILLLSDLW